MKHQFTATADVNRRAGNILIAAKQGEKLQLSDREAEAAQHFEELEYVGAVPETEPEEQFQQSQTEASETHEDLMKLKRDDLVEKTTGLGIPVNSETKGELAKAILTTREQAQLGGENNTEVTE